MTRSIALRAYFKRASSTTPLLIAALVLVIGLTASAMAWLAPANKVLPSALTIKAEASSSASPQQSLEAQEDEQVAKALLLTIRPAGFEPAEVTLPADSYLLVVQNRSGLRGVTLRLDEESRGRLLEMSLKARLDWRRRVNLRPGNYTISSADNPEWLCHVTVTP
jgi:hypothetical protein